MLYGMKAEDGTGSRRPLLGDAGVSPHLFHSQTESLKIIFHDNPQALFTLLFTNSPQ